MARPLNRLSARQVQTLGPGLHADGGGLYLQVTGSGGRSWIFRYRLPGAGGKPGKPRDMGLGPVRDVSLQEARQKAAAARKQRLDGQDPIATRIEQRARETRLWGDACDDFIVAHRAAWRSSQPGKGKKYLLEDGTEIGAQENQWRQSLTDHGPDRSLPVAAVTTEVIVAALKPLWRPRDQGGKTETATRVRGRIERIWYAERQKGNVAGENPARWEGHLEFLLPSPEKLKQRRHHPALPYDQAPALYAALRGRTSLSARALRFLLLTAARTDEVVGMPNLYEIDRTKALWLIPGKRMKADVDHEVPLVPAALELLDGLAPDAPPFDLSENAMLFFLQRDPPKGLGFKYTVHGLRSTFRTWVSETTLYSKEEAEMSLAHQIKDKTEAAYRRGKLRDKRRMLMLDWYNYLTGRPLSKMATIGAAAEALE